jgi:arsenate reductase
MAKKPVTEIYGLPQCSTCKKTVAWLEENGVEGIVFHDIKTTPLSRQKIEDLAEAVGGAETLFSKRARKYRGMGLHERTLSDDDMLQLMETEYTFITRPVIVRGDKALCGFGEKKMEALL